MSCKKIVGLIVFMIAASRLLGQNTQDSTNSTNIIVTPLSLNSHSNEYSLIPLGNRVIFCTNRKNGLIPYYSTNNNQLLDHLVQAEFKDNIRWKTEKLLIKQAYIKSNQGPACLSPDGKLLYFTGSCVLDDQDCEKNQNRVLKIYEAHLQDHEWSQIKELSFNRKRYSVGHPALSPDGLTIYFASNMPGGFGGSDLYASTLKNGQWGKPINLGPFVNTRGNELFPYISKENILYFSSDKHTGYGNLDIFSAKYRDSSWKNVRNIGKPFNSEFNDFSYIEDQTGFSGYFASNRREGTDDDLFHFEKLKPDCDTLTPFPYCFTFYEEGTLSSENLPLVYEWDFGDGQRMRGLEANHCFNKPGIYTINLNIIDTISGKIYFNEATYEMDVQELNKAHFDISGRKIPQFEIEFSADKSHLNDCIINEYLWNFGDGQSEEGITVTHQFRSKGKFEINLLVKGKSASSGANCMACVSHTIAIGEKKPELAKLDSASLIGDVAETLYSIKDENNLVYKVQVATSETPIPIDSNNFKNLEKVEEYKDFDNTFGYVVGKESDLAAAYPLYVDIKEKGYDEAKVVAFKDGRIISGKDTTRFRKHSNTLAFTQISGRIINRYGEPLMAEIILENLSTGKIISKILSDSIQGRFHIILPNEEIYGFYAELPGYYSVSNYIDLRNEKRTLEIKKNIEMVGIQELNEENISIRLNNIFFESNEYKLKKESYPELNRLTTLLKSRPGLKIEISGHTDNVGSPEANLVLSQKRSKAVKDYLIFMGIDKDLIIINGYGDSRPLVSNSTERGRYLNRRVEFRLFTE